MSESNCDHDIDLEKLVRGQYEAENRPSENEVGGRVPDFGYNVLNREGLLYEPIVDREHLSSGGEKPNWPNDADFAVCLTHDVDEVSLYSARQEVRNTVSKIRHRRSTGQAMKDLIKGGMRTIRKTRKRQDPIHCYERWLEAEEKVDAKSTFFFMPEQTNKPHETDSDYRFSDTVIFDGEQYTVAEMIREIDARGWEIGLHPTWNTYDDVEELKFQKGQLEDVVGHKIVSVRQHYLHYDVTKTPRVHAKAGFKYDSTLGFNDNIGFRFGTSYPWNIYDLENNEKLQILEIPLIIQDGAMLRSNRGLRLNEELAYDYMLRLIENVREVGGVLTLLWHPSYIHKEPWWRLFSKTLNYLSEQDIWIGSLQDIGSKWSNKTPLRNIP
ncbi:polysaccharide deacetylase family protein [Halorussus halobius]|uniref:polysaccharide deacetylase family protein n=1 Tax=Halorussus halobius TaxID=1710537 RepID=UPI00109204BF|nr:polysaccharide deacetylase family protein [Halorussus halobius]